VGLSREDDGGGLTAVSLTAQLLGRGVLTGLVRRLPPAVVAPIRQTGGRPNSVRGLLLRWLGRGLRRGGIPRFVRTFTLVDNPAVSFVNADSLVLHQLYWWGERGWEPELVPWWRHFCQRSSTIVEIGANVGYYTVLGAKAAPHARYICVEPHPFSADLCRTHVALNEIESVQVIEAAAVSDATASSIELVIPWEQLGSPAVAFLAAGSELPRRMADRPTTSITVPTIDVGSLLDVVDLLKIDAEGQEHALLLGAWPQLLLHRPTIFVEVLSGTPKLRDLLVRLCADVGYRCYAAHSGRLVRLATERIPVVRLREEFGTNDVILTTVTDL
jgi:FkbM family methyltransferase